MYGKGGLAGSWEYLGNSLAMRTLGCSMSSSEEIIERYWYMGRGVGSWLEELGHQGLIFSEYKMSYSCLVTLFPVCHELSCSAPPSTPCLTKAQSSTGNRRTCTTVFLFQRKLWNYKTKRFFFPVLLNCFSNVFCLLMKNSLTYQNVH